MNCLKCGRETVSEQVFCEDCLLLMEKYPVKPDTAVKLRERREVSAFRRPKKRRTVNAEEQVKILKGQLFRLTIVLMISFAVILLMIPPTLAHIMEDHHKVGQNYSVIVSTTAADETEAEAEETP